MAAGFDVSGQLTAFGMQAGSSSFTEFLSATAPELLPGRRPLPPGLAADVAPHGTTIVAVAVFALIFLAIAVVMVLNMTGVLD